MAKKKRGGGRKKLHGAALAAHNKRMRRGGSYKESGGGHHKKRSKSHGDGGHHKGTRRRRRNPSQTFGKALGTVLGGAAAMFGTGVLVTVATAKIAPGKAYSLYGIPAATALLGAVIARKMPLVGAGVAAGAAAPFVLPVSSMLLGGGSSLTPSTPASTVSALRAVAMGNSAWRSLNTYPRVGGVQMPLGGVQHPLGSVAMGAVRMGARAY